MVISDKQIRYGKQRSKLSHRKDQLEYFDGKHYAKLMSIVKDNMNICRKDLLVFHSLVYTVYYYNPPLLTTGTCGQNNLTIIIWPLKFSFKNRRKVEEEY